VHDLPRKLTAGELAELFEGRTRFVERLAALDDPLGRAREVAATLSDDEQQEVLDAHPAIGAPRTTLSARSAAEQGAGADDPATLAELAELNRAYEQRFGFRFVVFVNGRPKRAIVPILRERLGRTRAEELATGLDELIAIAEDRWRRQNVGGT
jgi:2-oxo-4-hydroxy-4-carboxy--5-ureidoimidazoline (OHCU) decarboxylase